MLLAGLGFLCALSSGHAETTALQAVVASELTFAQDLYELIHPEEGNLIYSPMSIQTVLGMTYLGANGTTASQMRDGLSLPEDDQQTKKGFKGLTAALKSGDDYTLEVANKIYADQTAMLEPAYKELAQAYFDSDVESVDFLHDSEAQRGAINKWVQEKTHGKIQELLKEGTVGVHTDFVLVSAMYFKGQWASAFQNTFLKKFYVTPDEGREVEFMSQMGKFGYLSSNELDCEILEMPYKGDDLSMVILLPHNHDMAALDRKITQLTLKGWEVLFGDIVTTDIRVHLPKFKVQQSHDLKAILVKRGMVDMFTDSADFSGITNKPVKVSKVVHEAFIEVNEEGTEAAAATGVEVTLFSNERTFNADHPFNFVVRHRRTNAILFCGRVSSL